MLQTLLLSWLALMAITSTPLTRTTAGVAAAAAAADYGDDSAIVHLDVSARVKQHRRGAEGNLVEGEEHMRKLLLQWDAVDGALGYEVCHNCQPTTGSEVKNGELQGIITPVPVDQTKAGRPVFIFPNAPLGKNTFHVRVSTKKNEWGPWSAQRTFNVDEEVGTIHHHEDDEL